MAVGAVYVDVLPSTRGFVRKMASDLERDGDAIGVQLGERIGSQVADPIAKNVASGIQTAGKQASDAMGKAGREAGQKFSQGLINEARQATAALRKELSGVETIQARIEINEGALGQVRNELAGLDETIHVHVDLDDDAVLDGLRDDLNLQDQHLTIDIDADTSALTAAQARVDVLAARLRSMPDIEFDADYNRIDQAAAATDRLGAAAKRASNEGQRLNKFQEFALLATVAFTPASAAVLGLAAAGLAVIAPIAAIAAGLQGIKAAVGPLAVDLNAMRSAVSAAFVTGLAPAVANVSRLFPTLTVGLTGTATALSYVATQMTGVLVESANMSTLVHTFEMMNEAVTGLGSPMGTLVDNALDFAEIGASALITFGPIMDQVGQAWDHVIASFQQTGLGEKAVVALIQVLGSLLTLAAPLVQLGAQMFAAIGPALAAAINGTAAIVQVFADAFAALPAPLQTAVATLLILRAILAVTNKSMSGLVQSMKGGLGKIGTGLAAPFREASDAASRYSARVDEAGKSTSTFGTAAQVATLNVSDKLGRLANDVGTKVPKAFDTAAKSITGPFVAAADRASKAFDALPAATARAFDGVKNAPKAALVAVNDFADRSGAKLTEWGNKGADAVDKMITGYDKLKTAPKAALDSINSAVDAGGAKLTTWGDKGADAVDRVSAGFDRLKAVPGATLGAINAGVDAAGAKMTAWGNLGADAVDRVVGATERARASVGTGFSGMADSAVVAAGRMTQAFDTGLTNGLNSLGQKATAAGRAISTGLSTAMDSAARTVETAGQKISKVGDVIGKGMEGGVRAVQSAAKGIGSALDNVVVVAERVGTRAGSGLKSAFRGITDVLGGPWGAALTGAMILLSLFGDKMADNAKKAADFKQSVTETAEAMRDTGGAITSSMRDQELLRAVQDGLGESAKTLGLNIKTLVDTAMTGGAGFDQLKTKLEETSRAGEIMSTFVRDSTGPISEQADAVIRNGEAADKLLASLGPLAEQYREAIDLNNAYKAAIQLSGNSMVGGIGVAAQLTSAFGTLSDEMSTTADRATALQAALMLLTGAPLSAEAAMAQFRTTLADLKTKFSDAAAAAKEAGVGIVDASGSINQATPAGRELVIAMAGVGATFADAATKAFDGAGGINNLAAAQQAAAAVTQEGRDAFIAMARQYGLNADQAAAYADQMGLIPALVPTLLSMTTQGLDTALQDMLLLQSTIAGLRPGTTEITVALSGEGAKLLRDAGVGVVDVGNGQFTVNLKDLTAPELAGIIASIAKQKGMLPVVPDTTAIPPGVSGAVAGVVPPQVPIVPDVGKVAPGVAAGVIGAKPPPVPIAGDTAPLTGDINSATTDIPAAQVQVVLQNVEKIKSTIAEIRTDLATPIVMTLTITDLAFGAVDATHARARAPESFTMNVSDAAFGAVDATHARARAAEMFTMGVADNAFGAVDATHARARAAEMFTMGVADNAFGAVDATHGRARAPEMFTMGVADNAFGAVDATHGRARAPETFTMGLTDNAFGAVDATHARARAAETFTMDVTDNAIGAVNETKRIAVVPVKFDWDVNDLAIGAVNETKRIAAEPVSFTVSVANAGAVENQLNNLARDRTATITVSTVGGSTLGEANGGLFQGYARGGTYNGHKLTPMAQGVARKVQANTYRVIGDRASKPESYIPWNNSARSKALLAATAKGMGFGLAPLARGGIMAADETLRLVQAARQRVATQSAGAFTKGAGLLGDLNSPDGKAAAAKLDEIAQLLREQPKGPQTITVEDRSGNPVETARKTALALRLAR